VTSINPGQFVIGSFFASDNTCPHCRRTRAVPLVKGSARMTEACAPQKNFVRCLATFGWLAVSAADHLGRSDHPRKTGIDRQVSAASAASKKGAGETEACFAIPGAQLGVLEEKMSVSNVLLPIV
jgi:hypothetical protein